MFKLLIISLFTTLSFSAELPSVQALSGGAIDASNAQTIADDQFQPQMTITAEDFNAKFKALNLKIAQVECAREGGSLDEQGDCVLANAITYESLTLEQIEGELGFLQDVDDLILAYGIFGNTQPGPHSGGYNIPTDVYEPVLNEPVSVSYFVNTSVEVYEFHGVYHRANDCYLSGTFRVNGSGAYGTGQPLEFVDASGLNRTQCMDYAKWFYNSNDVVEGSFTDDNNNIYYTYYVE